ncbi:MAG: hypothetical protein CR217_09835 [Beijerinckiaceae bacterium]|nr:MAG: hypothetical protein CR217_09835 [Beijerinckiaceae bacterium]
MSNLPWSLRGDNLVLSVRLTPKSACDEIGGSYHLADGRTVLKVRLRALVSQTLALHLPGGMVANAG